MHWDVKNEEIMYHVTVFATVSEVMSTSYRSYSYHISIPYTDRQTDNSIIL